MIIKLAASLIALTLTTGSVFALTLTNNGSKDATIGVDYGGSKKDVTVPAGQSVTVDDCADECGVSAPWGSSKFNKGTDAIKFDDNGFTPFLPADKS